MLRFSTTLFLLTVCLSLSAQLKHDSNNDGCVGSPDLISLLSEYGTCDLDSVPLYYFHGGNSAWPFALQWTDPNNPAYLPAESWADSSYIEVTNVEAFAFIMDNIGTEISSPYYPGGGYTVQTILFPPGTTVSDAPATYITFPPNAYNDGNYVIVNEGFGDLTNRFSQCFTLTVQSQVYEYGGENWVIYDLGMESTFGNSIQFNY